MSRFMVSIAISLNALERGLTVFVYVKLGFGKTIFNNTPHMRTHYTVLNKDDSFSCARSRLSTYFSSFESIPTFLI